MHRIDGLSKAQRVVVVIALGLALDAVGSYLVSLGGGNAGFGWVAPVDSAVFVPAGAGPGFHGWVIVIIWLVLIGAWALASVRVLRPSAEKARLSDP